jgi:hypothetical protein
VDLTDLGLALVVATFGAFPLGITIWALLDAARRPQWAWALSGRRQVVWMAAIMFAALTVIGGLILSTWYLTRVRHDIADAEDGRVPDGR